MTCEIYLKLFCPLVAHLKKKTQVWSISRSAFEVGFLPPKVPFQSVCIKLQCCRVVNVLDLIDM